MSDRSRVALVYGFWGQNIGNAFFNVGGEWLLREALGTSSDVYLVQDQPGYRTFHNQRRGNPPNDAGLLAHVDVDAVVLQGPMLTRTFRPLWESAFRRYRESDTRVVLLGGALFRFDQPERDEVASFLREYPPAIFISRDRESFEFVSRLGLPTACFDGIDSAFFVNRAVGPIPLGMDPFVTFTFDRYPEPTLVPASTTLRRCGRRFSFDGIDVEALQPRLPYAFSARGKWQAYLGDLIDRRRFPARYFGRLVVRPEHRSNPHVTPKIYRRSNAVASDEPYTYIALYAQTDLTLSDRVHACVVSAAFGRPAMLFSPTPRASLFDRIGLTKIRESPVVLDPQRLAREQNQELAFLVDAFADLGLAGVAR